MGGGDEACLWRREGTLGVKRLKGKVYIGEGWGGVGGYLIWGRGYVFFVLTVISSLKNKVSFSLSNSCSVFTSTNPIFNLQRIGHVLFISAICVSLYVALFCHNTPPHCVHMVEGDLGIPFASFSHVYFKSEMCVCRKVWFVGPLIACMWCRFLCHSPSGENRGDILCPIGSLNTNVSS